MADIAYEGVGYVVINGRTQAQCKNITVNLSSNDKEVTTMALGFAGFSDGAGMASIDVESAVPKKGFEKSFARAVTDKETVSIVYKSGGTRFQFTGRFTEATMKNDTESPASTSGKFVGGMPKLTGG
jgi:hypothetical protein